MENYYKQQKKNRKIKTSATSTKFRTLFYEISFRSANNESILTAVNFQLAHLTNNERKERRIGMQQKMFHCRNSWNNLWNNFERIEKKAAKRMSLFDSKKIIIRLEIEDEKLINISKLMNQE